MDHKSVIVNNSMQKGYKYVLTEPVGKNFDPDFTPDLTPKEMIDLGVFGGHYDTINSKEFPKEWFLKNNMMHAERVENINYFKINASLPLSVWIRKGWIHEQDPGGWFLWYCRYYVGRRTMDDERQIKRWKAMKRHIAQIKKNCKKGDLNCRRRQRQALLHWAYDTRKI